MRIMGYVHHGTEHYMNSYGDMWEGFKPFRRFKDRMKGMWMGLRKLSIDNFSDHSMVNYIENISKWK